VHDAGFRKKHLMMHGSLYLFSNYMGYHSTLPFGYTKNRIIPFKVQAVAHESRT